MRALTAGCLVLSWSFAASAADEPEDVYARFHAAGLAADFEAMRKHGTAAKAEEMAAMPEQIKGMMLRLLAEILPRRYSIAGRTIDPGGSRATLQVTAAQDSPGGKPAPVEGTIVLLKENGEWKVDRANWDTPPAASKPPPKVAAAPAPGPIPERTAEGVVHGAKFRVERASVQNGILQLRQGKQFFADQEFKIFMFLNRGEAIDGRKFSVKAEEGAFTDPSIHLSYKVEGASLPRTETFSRGYAMTLEFGRRAGNRIKGKVDLRLPDGAKSFVSGTFEAEIK